MTLKVLSRAAVWFLIPVMAGVLASAAAAAPDRHAAIIIDVNTGKVLHEASADAQRYPASLTKMMTLYLTFEQIKAGKLDYNTKIFVSDAAANVAPSKLELSPGDEIALIDAIKALITKSANDMAVALAERIAGSEAAFARLMTERARQIGMRNTTFRNASGLPDPGQVTTARDMATLALRLYDDFPDQFRLFSMKSFTYAGKTYRTHNTLMHSFAGMDGIKTGYTRASGYNLVSSVHRDGLHLIGVVFGGATASSRNAHMRFLLQRAMVDASTEKTRVVRPLLVATPTPVSKPAKKVAAVERPQAVVRPIEEPKRMPPPAGQAPSKPAEPVAASTPPVTPSEASASPQMPTPPIEIVTVRSVPMPLAASGGQSPEPAPQVAQKQPLLAGSSTRKLDFDALRQAIASQPDTPAPPAQASTPAMQAPAPTAPPTDRETVLSMAPPPLNAPGRPPSTLEAQAAALISDAPPARTDLAAGPAGPPSARIETVVGRPPSTLDAQAAGLAGQQQDMSSRSVDAHQQLAALPTNAPPAMRLNGPVNGARTDYEIQIGAYASADEAERRMDAAKKQEPTLAAHAALALPHQDGSRTLYRARFAGFGASEAADACSALKRKAFECMVVRPQ